MPYHTVIRGDCISSIATNAGLTWQQVWDDPENAKLRELRKDPNILAAGDVVFVPDKKLRTVSGGTNTRHRFVKRGVPAMFRIQLFDGVEPRKNQSYVLNIDGKEYKGTTNGEGVLEQPISPTAVVGELTVGPDQLYMTLEFGHIDPITELSGIQARLTNLGFDCGSIHGELDETTGAAIAAFQHRFGLEATGRPNAETIAKIEELHDRVGTIPPFKPKATTGGAS